MKKNDYIIGTVSSNNSVSISKLPVIHNSWQSAKNEAERLAKNNPDKKFIVFCVSGLVQATTVSWE